MHVLLLSFTSEKVVFMFKLWITIIVPMSVLLVCHPIQAEVVSGPTKGDPVPGITVHAVTGDVENEELDYVKKRKDKPTIYAFVQSEHWSRPMARFLRKLDENIANIDNDAYIVAIWLTDDVEKSKAYLPRAQISLKLESTAFTSYTDTAGPGTWGINSDAHITVVISNKGKVITATGYLSINETVVPQVEKALKSALNK